MSSQHERTNHPTRRQALKALAAASGAATIASLPSLWSRPVVRVGAVPAHAQASRCNQPGALYASVTWSADADIDLILQEPSSFRVHPNLGAPAFGNGGVSPNTGATHSGDATTAGMETIIMPPGGADNDPGIYTIALSNHSLSRVTITYSVCTECENIQGSADVPAAAALLLGVQFPGGCLLPG